MNLKFSGFLLFMFVSQLSFAVDNSKPNLDYKLAEVQKMLKRQDVLISSLSKKINYYKKKLKVSKTQNADSSHTLIIAEYETFIDEQDVELERIKLRQADLVQYLDIVRPRTVLSSLEGFELFTFFSSLNTILVKFDGRNIASSLVLDETKKQMLVASSAQLLTLFPELIKGLYNSDELVKAVAIKKIKDAVEVLTVNMIDILEVNINGVKTADELVERINSRIEVLSNKREATDL
ncbi:MAG: hypothetical protein O2897_01560 [bacterium]|nr:hypothetical protein [bacterium]